MQKMKQLNCILKVQIPDLHKRVNRELLAIS